MTNDKLEQRMWYSAYYPWLESAQRYLRALPVILPVGPWWTFWLLSNGGCATAKTRCWAHCDPSLLLIGCGLLEPCPSLRHYNLEASSASISSKRLCVIISWLDTLVHWRKTAASTTSCKARWSRVHFCTTPRKDAISPLQKTPANLFLVQVP